MEEECQPQTNQALLTFEAIQDAHSPKGETEIAQKQSTHTQETELFPQDSETIICVGMGDGPHQPLT